MSSDLATEFAFRDFGRVTAHDATVEDLTRRAESRARHSQPRDPRRVDVVKAGDTVDTARLVSKLCFRGTCIRTTSFLNTLFRQNCV